MLRTHLAEQDESPAPSSRKEGVMPVLTRLSQDEKAHAYQRVYDKELFSSDDIDDLIAHLRQMKKVLSWRKGERFVFEIWRDCESEDGSEDKESQESQKAKEQKA